LTDLTSTSLKSGGNITSDGGNPITARGVCWSTHQDPTVADNKTSDGSGSGIYSSSITGLTPGTTYYIRAYATNIYGTVYDRQLAIKMAIGLPVITTNQMAGIYTYSANAAGNISSSGGGDAKYGVCWSDNPTPTISENKSLAGVNTGNNVNFTSMMFGLNPSTTYYVRAYATNSVGTVYGDQISFMTNDEVSPAEDYLPLQVGNYWELSNEKVIQTLTIDQIDNIGGLEYYRMIRSGDPWKDTVYFRKTADGRIYQRGTKSPEEIVRYYLGGSKGETWKYPKDPTRKSDNGPMIAYLLSKTDTVNCNSQTFDKCYSFHFDPYGEDNGEWTDWLAPGIGFVKIFYAYQWTNMTNYRRLIKVRINGVETTY